MVANDSRLRSKCHLYLVEELLRHVIVEWELAVEHRIEDHSQGPHITRLTLKLRKCRKEHRVKRTQAETFYKQLFNSPLQCTLSMHFDDKQG